MTLCYSALLTHTHSYSLIFTELLSGECTDVGGGVELSWEAEVWDGVGKAVVGEGDGDGSASHCCRRPVTC